MQEKEAGDYLQLPHIGQGILRVSVRVCRSYTEVLYKCNSSQGEQREVD